MVSCKYEPVISEDSSSVVIDDELPSIDIPKCEGDCFCNNVINRFNDTGITDAGDYPSTNLPNCSLQSGYLQDCAVGKGEASFNFTKLDQQGSQLDDSAENWQCVLDNTSGLIWEVKSPVGNGDLQDALFSYSWRDDAYPDYSVSDQGECDYECDTQSYLARLNQQKLCGFDDWRLPSKVELHDIVNYQSIQPTIDQAFFPHTQNAFYWTNSIDTDDIASVWTIGFNEGRVAGVTSDNARAIRAVRGIPRSTTPASELPSEETLFANRVRFAPKQRCAANVNFSSPIARFKQNDKGNIFDTQTGLTWQRCVVGKSGVDCSQGEASKLDWQQAFEYANQQTQLLQSDTQWRLPSIKELQQTIELACEEPALNPFIFPNVPLGEVWSSSPHIRIDDQSYQYQYQNSIIFYSPRTQSHYVHLVRDCADA